MHKKLIFLFILFISLVFVFITSCEKSTNIGFDLVPKKYVFTPVVQDTFTIQAFTIPVDSIKTSGFSKGLLGTYVDPIFGDVRASFVTQIRPNGTWDKKEEFEYDSIVLYLKYDTTYAQTDMLNQINIFEITEAISDTITYFDDFDPSILNPIFMNTGNYRPSNVFGSKILLKGDTLTNTLAIKLEDEYGIRLFNSDTLTESFYKIFKGLYICPDNIPYNGTISIFNLIESDSKVTLHYHDKTITDNDSLTFSFNLSGYGGRINIFEHEFNAPGFLPDLDNPESKQDSVIYLQGAAGLNAKIKIPYLDQLKNQGTYAVNRAELILQTESDVLSYESTYPAPEELVLYALTSEGQLEYLNEYIGPSSYLGTNYDDGQYFFDLTYIVQKIIKGEKPNNGFVLSLADGAYNPARVVLTSGSHSRKLKFRLTLTKI